MIKDILRQILSFVVFLLVQVLVVNNIHLQAAWFINPFVYVGFVLLLPVDTPKWLLLVSAFLMGYMVDVFSSTAGMHATATVLLAFLRHYLLNVMLLRNDCQPGTRPDVGAFGFPWFIKYVTLMVAAHHFTLFFVEAFSLKLLHIVILKTIASGLFTVVLLLVGQLFLVGNVKNR